MFAIRPKPQGRLPAAAVALAAATFAVGPARAEPPLPLQPSTELAPAPRGDAAAQRPLFFGADRLRLRPDVGAEAEGDVELRRAGTVIRADRVDYDAAEDRADARGGVRIAREGAVYAGPALQLKLQRFEGFFLDPAFEFESLGAGGRARRVDFLDSNRARAEAALYTSCPRDGSGAPDWLLQTDRVTLDFGRNDGVAEGAVLRFLDVPILALPTMSFPLTDARRSGWLPPLVGLDNRNGLILGVPWYWNLAPNRDATIQPTLVTRRGLAVEGELRWLEPGYAGQLNLHVLPDDHSVGHGRGAIRFAQDGELVGGWRVRAEALHVSDQGYWKDFPAFTRSAAPRLLAQDLLATRPLATPLGDGEAYVRVQYWQLMQTGSGDELIVAPYQRSPQLGWRTVPASHAGFTTRFETELSHFSLPAGSASPDDPTGWRAHVLASVARPLGDGAWWLTPKLTFNAASYTVEQAGNALLPKASRLIPTAGIDTGAVLERETDLFGRGLRQTLEPRLLFTSTPWRDQSRLPNFDAANRTFNFVSIYAENPFAGIDRVADVHGFTAGVTTRLIDARTGAEALRLALAQRVLLREQRITPDGLPNTRRVSDLLAEGSSVLVRDWRLDAALQYNPDRARIVNAALAARWSPGPFRTLSAGYRLTNSLSIDPLAQNAEQLELGWQWPVFNGTARPVGAAKGCGGTLYAVGRVNYSLRDSRLTDALAGVEYDAGCWIGRIVGERLSTGRSEATTRLMFQLELVGLSRLGSNPLQSLKDNIPGYRLLREPRTGAGDAPQAMP